MKLKLIAPKFAVNDGNPKHKFHLLNPNKDWANETVCRRVDCQFMEGTEEHNFIDAGYTSEWHVKKRISQLEPEQICQKCLGPLKLEVHE